MECPKCQTKNPEARKYCCECGAKLVLLCRKCGSENFPEDKFCGECGHNLKKSAEPSPIDYSQPQSYTPKHLADKILTTRSAIQGERKLVTVLFADVVDFTSISEKLDPEDVHDIMDGCFRILLDEIHRYEGTINQFTGDGVMALFGAPVAHEGHAQRACYAALSIQKAIGEYGEKVNRDRGVEFKMRIGLNSGPVVVGSIGDDLRMDYTAVGDTTNLASRMESAAKPGSALVSANTHRLVMDFFEFHSLGKLEVKGKKESQEVFELIKTGDVETRIGASVAKGLTRFVGRKNSMAAAMESFDKAKSGSGQILALVGEAGVGKSRLLLEMRNRLPQNEIVFLEGRCLHYGGTMAYLPILDILRLYFEIQEGDSEYIIKKKMKEGVVSLDEKLTSLLLSLQDLLSLTVDDDQFTKLEPKMKREKTFEALRDLVIRISHGKPMVLAIEDLHWIDRTSEDFLDYFIGWLPNSPILLILLYRPEYINQWGSKSYYTQIRLNQLGTASSGELIKAILEEGDAEPELKQLIFDRAAGNPLFMEEFTHTLLENGSIEKRDDQYILNRKPSEIQVPDTIQGIIAARMDRLEDSIKRTMQVASVIGRDFAFRILQTISGMHEELKSYLLNLQRLEFIYEKRLFPELEYIFKHVLIQEVAYNSLLLKRRKEIHEKIGKAIEELYPERLEEFYEILAHHYSKSKNLEKAYQYLKLSGDKASRSSSNWEAFRFYKEAINVLNQLPETEENKRRGIEVRVVMDFPMMGLAYPEDSLQIILEGERLARELGEEKNLAKLLSMIGCCSITQGDHSYGLKYNEIAFEVAERLHDVDIMAPIGFDLCVSYWIAGESLKTVEVARKVLTLVEKTQSEYESFDRGFNIYSQLLELYGYAVGMLGDLDEAEALCERGLRFAQEIDDRYSLSWIEFFYGWMCANKGDGENTVQHFQNTIRYCEETQNFFILPLAWAGFGWGYHLLGDLVTDFKYIEKALKMQLDMEHPTGLSIHYYVLGMLYFDSGNLVKAQDCLKKALELALDNHETVYEGITRTLLGTILGRTEVLKSSEAEECILQGIKILDGLKAKPYCARGYLHLGEFYTSQGQREKALKNLKKAQNIFQELGMGYWLRRAHGVLGGLQA